MNTFRIKTNFMCVLDSKGLSWVDWLIDLILYLFKLIGYIRRRWKIVMLSWNGAYGVSDKLAMRLTVNFGKY